MGIKNINKWEQAVVLLLNFDGWDLEWTGEGYAHYDAKGKTPKGFDCVIEMKFRNKHYETKMLEKYKHDALMALNEDIIKIYYVFDPKGNYLYWLNALQMPPAVKKYCPDTTIWTKKRMLKDVYLLKETDASRININFSKKKL
jgi:hypothetical protein